MSQPQPTEDQPNEIWKTWAADADALPELKVDIADTGLNRKSLSDRLAFLTLEGYLPLLAISAVLLSLSAGHTSITSWLAGLLATPFLALIFQPLVRSRQGMKPITLWLVFPLLLLASSTASGLARLAEHRLSSGFIHMEYVALAWQLSLESLLTPASIAVAASVLLLLSIIVNWTHRRFPWVQLNRKQTWWSKSPLLLLLTLIIGIALWTVVALHLAAAQKKWLESAATSSQSRPYSSLPADSEVRFWRDRNDKLKTSLEDHTTPTLDGTDYWTPENIKEAIADFPTISLDSAPPTSLAEVYAAHNYLSYMGHSQREDRLQPSLDFLKLFSGTRPYRTTGNFNWFFDELLGNLNLVTDEPTLRLTLDKLRTIREHLGTPEDGLEHRAYHLLAIEPAQLTQSDEIGWKTVDHLVRPDKFTKGWSYKANPKPHPLRAFGREFAYSPTRFGAFYQRRQLLKRWVEFNRENQGLAWPERMANIHSTAEALPLEGTTEDSFWAALLEWEFVPNEIAGLKQAEILVLLKLYRQSEGELPKTLQAVADQVDFSAELQEQFNWDPLTGKLTDRVTGRSVEIPVQ